MRLSSLMEQSSVLSTKMTTTKKMDNKRIRDIDNEIESLKKRMSELQSEKSSIMMQDSAMSQISPGDFMDINDLGGHSIMRVNKVQPYENGIVDISGYSLSVNDNSLLVSKNAMVTHHLMFEKKTFKIKKISKEEFVKTAAGMLRSSIRMDEILLELRS